MNEVRREQHLPEEDELIGRIKAGDSQLFELLLGPYARKMYALAYSILRNDHDAEEAVQESALKAFTRLNQLRSSSSFKCWLFQITVNEARMRRRRARLCRCSSLDDEQISAPDGSAVAVQFADQRENPEQAARRKQLEAAIDDACNELPSKYQKILRMRCVENLSLSEIGGELSLGIPAVKTQLHRARLRLRTQLAPFLPSAVSAPRRPRGVRRAPEGSNNPLS
jgi:RNA polymerase sigma-70 factor (ECF subfamily)